MIGRELSNSLYFGYLIRQLSLIFLLLNLLMKAYFQGFGLVDLPTPYWSELH